MKKIGLSLFVFIIMPTTVFLVWQVTNAIFDLLAGSVAPIVELWIAILEGFVVPILLLMIVFKRTHDDSESYKTIRICGVAGLIITIILVLIAIPWIKMGIAFRGVNM